MIAAMATSVVLVVTTILIVYETLRLTSNHLTDLPVRPRMRIIAVVLAAFVGHTATVWTYALGYWVLSLKLQVGSFAGLPVESFQDCLYFSGSVAVTWKGHNEPSRKDSSSGKAEELGNKTDFACRAGLWQDTMAAADHPHDLKSFQGRGGGFHPLEAAGRPN
jgi:hypothetical protein